MAKRIKTFFLAMTALLVISCGTPPSTSYTGNLPSVDKVELFKLKKHGDLWRGEIEAQKVIIDADVQAIAELWRNQSYSSDSAICHNPGYGIKFYSQNQIVVYATLCWECNNIEFLNPKVENYVGFAGKSSQGQELLRTFENAFQ